MIVYQKRAEVIAAHRVTSAADAAEVIGGTVAGDAEGVWNVRTSDGRLWSGVVGDYLVPVAQSWRVVSAADFDAEWMLPPADWMIELADLEEAKRALDALVEAAGSATTLAALKLALRDYLLPPLVVLGRLVGAMLATYRREVPEP